MPHTKGQLRALLASLILAILMPGGSVAQTARRLDFPRTFDFEFPAPADSTMDIIAPLDSALRSLPRQELAAAAYTLVNGGHLDAAEVLANTLTDLHPNYAYTGMLKAYLAQARAIFYAEQYNLTQEASYRSLAFSELTTGAYELEQVADMAQDSTATARSLLMAASEMRYQAEQGEGARADMARVLALHPSADDSLDILIMLADFDRMDSLYESARQRYETYYAARPELGRTPYDAAVGAGYLNTLYTLGLHDTPTMRQLSQEADRYILHAPQEIRYRRYKRQAAYALMLAEPQLGEDAYIASLQYVEERLFPDSIYDYDDYYAAADVARRTQQWDAYISHLRQCIALYEDPSVTRRQTLDDLYAYLTEALGGLERNEQLAHARRDYANVKKARLGQDYEPYYDTVNQGAAYFDAMKAAEQDEQEAARLYLLADSCFQTALQRTQTIDSLQLKQRVVIANYAYANHRTILYNLRTQGMVDSIYTYAVNDLQAKAAYYADSAHYEPEILTDIASYERNLTTILAEQAPSDTVRQHYFALAEQQLREAILKASPDERTALLALHYRLHGNRLLKALEQDDNAAAFQALQNGLQMLSSYEEVFDNSYIVPYYKAQIHLTYDRRGDNQDAVDNYLLAALHTATAPEKVQHTIYVYLARYYYLEWGKTWDDRETRYGPEDVENARRCKQYYALLRALPSSLTSEPNTVRIISAIEEEDLLWKKAEYNEN